MPLQTQDAALDEGQSSSPLRPVDVDRYEVTGELGEGGLGTVLRARDKRLNRWVAIKLLRRLSAEHEQRFFNEAELTARLEHPAIVPVHDVGRWTSGAPFYAMKLVEGKSLSEVISGLPTLLARLPLVTNVLTVCDAIGYAHARGVIHRDLKPSNVMVGPFGETLVIDWGLARDVGAPDSSNISGTPHYMSPEQASGKAVDARSDVYALGAMLYEVLSGRPPWEDVPTAEVLARAARGSPPSLEQVTPDAPHELAAIVDKAMSREAAQRYPDARGLGADLRRYLDGQLVGAYRYSRWQRLRRAVSQNKPAAAAIGLGTVALLLVGGLSLSRIITERDLARAARELAERSRGTAEARRDQLMLAQAQLWLDKDPTVAFAWVRAFAATPSARPESVSAIAVSAISRGVATQLTRGRTRVTLSPDGHTLAGVEKEQLVVWTLSDAHARVLGKVPSLAVLRFSPDGKAVLVTEGTLLRRWDLAGQPPQTLFTAPQELTALAVSGGAVALGGAEGALWVSASPGAKFETHPALGSPIKWLEISGARERVLASDADGQFELLSFAPGAALLSGHGAGGARMSADGSHVGWSGGDGSLWAFEVATGKRTLLKGRHEGEIAAVAISADGQWLASFGQDHLVFVDQVQTGVRRVLKGHEAWVLNASFSPDGSQLISISGDRTARRWNLETGDVQVLRGHTAAYRLFTFTPDGQRVITGDTAGEVRVWPAPASEERVLTGHLSEYIESRFLPDGRVVAAGEDGLLQVWNPADGARELLHEPGGGGSLSVSKDGRILNAGNAGAWFREATSLSQPPHVLQTGEVHKAVLNQAGTLLATAGSDHHVRVFSLPEGVERVLGTHAGAAWGVAFSPDSRFVASTGDDFVVRVWPLGEGAPFTLAGPEGVVFELNFSPDGRWLAAVGVDGAVHLWDTATWQHQVRLGHQGVVRQVRFSPDSSRVLSASDDHSVRVWLLASEEPPRVLDHGSMVFTAAFSSDGTQVVSGADDGAVRLWNAVTGQLLAVRTGHQGPLTEVAVSPDGRSVATSAEDHTVRHWPDFFRPLPRPENTAALALISSVVLSDDRAGSESGP